MAASVLDRGYDNSARSLRDGGERALFVLGPVGLSRYRGCCHLWQQTTGVLCNF